MPTVDEALQLATEFALQRQSDNHWCGVVHSNATVTAQWIFFHQSINRSISEDHRRAYLKHFISTQSPSGAWTLAPQSAGNLSTTIEAYCALKILGLPFEHPVLVRSRQFIRSAGGMENMRMLTRVYLAMFGLVDWKWVPQIPPEIILLPDWFPVNVYRFASWARSNIIPLSIIRSCEPIFELKVDGWSAKQAQSSFLDELWLDPREKELHHAGLQLAMFRRCEWMAIFFHLAELVLGILVAIRFLPLRRKATRKCMDWIKSHQELEGDWAGIYPPMHLGVLALYLEDAESEMRSSRIASAVAAMDRFCAEDSRHGRWMQASVSPTWDTFLMLRALADAGTLPKSHQSLTCAVEWTHAQQIVDTTVGDWRVTRPHGKSGGFCFEYFNAWYPDVDDTAAAVLALLHQNPAALSSETVITAAVWVLDMQGRDGGWAAFDADNDAHYLNTMPLADMKNLCDPSTPDVTGRCLEMLGTMLQLNKRSEKPFLDSSLHCRILKACQWGTHFVQSNVTEFGGWTGRWAVNYIFGTATVLCGLKAIGVSDSSPIVGRALDWLASVQKVDGGWGEDLNSYTDISLAGRGSVSTPSQTAWALMGLLAYRDPTCPSIVKGADWLTTRIVVSEISKTTGDQNSEIRCGTWKEDIYTATGFPGHFYLGYSLYCHYFPMMALGRLRNYEGRLT